MAEQKFVDPLKSWARAVDEGMALMMTFITAPLTLSALALERTSKVLSISAGERGVRPRTRASAAAASSRPKIRRGRRR